MARPHDPARGRLAPTLSEPFSDATPADPEESLRVFMVRLTPRVARRTATPEDRSQFVEKLAELWQPAHSADLRFLDAWNNAYEFHPYRDSEAKPGACPSHDL